MTTRYPLVLNGTTIQELQSGDALTGISYNDLSDKPTIPTVPTIVSSFTNDAGYLTSINSSQVTTALGYTPINAATKGTANGVASLDASGLVPSTQLPSYVDDVLEYANQAAFPATGSTGKIYVALDTNKTYRWSGSAYIEISASPGSTDAVTEGSTNLYFTQARARASVSTTQNLTYNSTTGVITGPDLSGYLTSSTASSTYQPLDADLTAIGGLAGTSGLLKKTAANTWTLDTSAYLTSITSGQVTTALGYTPYNSTNPNGYTSNTGTVTSVGMTVPTGLSVSGTPITGSGTLAISLASGYSIPTTASQTNWDTAYTDRNKWDGGATGLVAATGRTSLGVTATGSDTTYAYRANNLSDLASATTARTNLGLGTAATMAGPSGPIVGTTDTQTLTNKTFTGYTETVYNLTGTAINPANGTIQYKTLSANTTFTESLADGQCVTLMLNPATYTVTWPTTTWVGSVASTAPTLVASVYNCITFFQIAGVLYGKYEGRV